MTTKYRIHSWLGLIALLFGSTAASISAAEFFVSTTGNDTNVGSSQSPVATIQRGIAIASNGDTVWISPGTYSGVGNREVSLQGKILVVRSMQGPSVTIIDCGRAGKAFSASTTETTQTTIDGLSIINGLASSSEDWGGTGIVEVRDPAGMTVKNCIFRDNEVTVGYLTTCAQIVSKWSNPTFARNEGTTLVDNCLFYSNTTRGGSYAAHFSRVVGIHCGWGSPMHVSNCTFSKNQVLIGEAPKKTVIFAMGVSDCIVWGNSNATGPAIYAYGRPIAYTISDGITVVDDVTNSSNIGVISNDPLFTNPNTNNFTLQTGSPGIDGGDPIRQDPDGSALDIGFRLDRFVGYNMVLTLGAHDHGEVVGAGNYPQNATATLTATANSGYIFTGWSGDATGSVNPLLVVMNADKTVSATFAPNLTDNDTDGLTAYDEVVIYGTDPTKDDTDGDGLKDGWEVGLGRFSIVPGNFTWAQARADAHARGGELACFPTADLWNRAMETLGANALDDYTGLWIGASDATTEGTWTWVNGDAFAFNQWEPGRPNATAGNTLDYAEVSGGNGSDIGKWYDRTGTLVRDGYILEMGYNTDPLVADADADGLNDGQEQAAGTNPFMADTDGDGLTDGQEVNLMHTNPKLADSNGNGTSDAMEDSDGDGLSNIDEITKYGTDPLKADTDGDGISDGAEVHHPGSFFKLVQGAFTYQQALADATAKRGRVASFSNAADYSRMAAKARQTTQGCLWIGLSDAATEGTWVWGDGSTATYNRWVSGQPDGGAAENHAVIMENSTQWADAVDAYVAAGYLFERVGLDPLNPDTDGDGLTDGQEINTTHTNPLLEDTDGDGLPDGAEVNTYGSNPLLVDSDGDGISDRDEVGVYHTNPALKDSDVDGFDDLFEINTGFNPNLASSTPDEVSSIRTAVEFRFNAANGVSYRIEASTDLSQWDVIEPAVIGQSAVVTRFYTTENLPKRFFRVRRN